MSIVTAVILVGVSAGCVCAAIHRNSPAAQEERRRQIRERWDKIPEPFRKKSEKRRFITKFIYEIPELSFYEAVQLQNKLGDIYLEWNDE